MNIRKLVFAVTLLICGSTAAQTFDAFFAPSDTLNTSRRNYTIGAGLSAGIGGLLALNSLWYRDYPKASFHFVNDNAQWLQMDKVGHAYGTYHLGRFSTDALKWSGAGAKESMWYGATAGFVFITAIEIMDGHSANWGASSGDIAANAAGTAIFVGQELLWQEQRIIPKFSFHTTPYAGARPNVLGSSYTEQLLKDYNGQTYWLSANLYSFAKQSNFPKWLNVAVGYGGQGMITGDDSLVNTIFLPDQARYRQYYLSLDIDLTKIPTQSNFLKTLFSVVSTVKIPAPTVEYTSAGNVKFHVLYF